MGKRGTERFATLHVLVTGLAEPTRTVKLTAGMNLRQDLDFRINGERHHHNEPVKVGELQVWDVVNGTLFHFELSPACDLLNTRSSWRIHKKNPRCPFEGRSRT